MSTINDVLDLSKIEAGGLELEHTTFDLFTCLEHIQHILSRRALDKKLDLDLRIESGVPRRVVGDEVRLRQVVMNLAANSVKFTVKGGVTITVGVESSTPASVRLRFEVSDTGIGIAISRQIGRARVLVAEDNLVNQRVVLRMLEKLGCEADLASNGSEAVLLARTRRYDLIFMDCQMPELSDLEATREIRRNEGEGKRVPIVALTANALTGDREFCLAAGMDEYITKPVRREALAAMMSRFVADGENA